MVNFSMDPQTGHVLEKLFSEQSLDTIPLERLQRIVDEHPYFAFGHFLLAKKLQTLNAPEHQAQSEKAALYFTEPIWLQSLLHPAPETHHVIRERIIEETTAHEQPEEVSQPFEESISNDVDANQSQPIEETQDVFSTDVTAVEVIEEEIAIAQDKVEETTMASDEQDVPIEQSEIVSDTPVAENAEEPTKEPQQIFEPYHTVDYFASQGIKVSNELKPNDRLGQQLRSFTEWLKSMKRFPETQIEKQLDEVAQQNIQQFASHSLDEKEVVTESMAEVLLKQNRYPEAIAIYEKLSLLNPSKRAYFAAKIEQLKGL
jgi:hypothetical protein